MKKSTQKLVLTKTGTINKNILSALQNCRYDGNKIFYKRWSRNGGYHNLADYSFHLINILDSQKYKYTFGNDSPRGGKDGDYIKVSSTARKFINSLL